MKTATFKRCLAAPVILLFSFFSTSLLAQSKCPGVNAQVTNAPVINLCTGTSVTLNAQTAAAYSYQWQKQTSGGGVFANISGATTSSYVTNDIGAFRIIVGNGACADTSTIVNVIRLNLVGGTITRSGSNAICPNESAGILSGNTVPGDDIGIITYQWEKKVGSASYTAIVGANGLNYTTTLIPSSTTYKRGVSDNCGNVVYSNEITINTLPALLAGSIAPSTQTIPSGSAPALLSSATNPSGGSGNLMYQWQYSPAENGEWTNISGATGLTYQSGALLQTTYFRRVATDVVCGSTSSTLPVVVKVTNAPLNPGVITSVSACVFAGNSPAILTALVDATGGTPPYQYQWESRTAAGSFAPIPGATGSSYQPGALTQTTFFRKKVTDATGASLYTNAFGVNFIGTPLNGGQIMTDAMVACLGSSPAKLRSFLSASGYGEQLQYAWQMKTDGGMWVTIPGVDRGDYQPEPLLQKTTFRRVTMDGCGVQKREAYSNEIAIDVKPALFAGDIRPSSQMIASGSTPARLTSFVDPSGGTNSYTISWQQASLAVGPFTTIAGATGLSYQPPALSASTYYRRVVQDNNCLAVKYTYVLEVVINPEEPLVPGTLAGSTCVFPGNRPSVISGSTPVSGGVKPYSFQWENRTSTAAAFVAIPGATGEQYQPPVITQSTQYRRKVTDGAGRIAYSDVLSVQYISTALNGGTIAPTNSSICGGTTPGIIRSLTSGSGYGEEARYQWQFKTEGGAWTNIAGATDGDYTPGILTQTTYFRRAFFDKCSGVERIAYSNEVVIKVTPVSKLLAGLIQGPCIIACTGTSPGQIRSVLNACGGCNNVYSWEVNTGGGWTIVSGATGASYTPSNISGNTKYRRKVMDASGNWAYSNEIEIFVYPPIEAGTIGEPFQLLCGTDVPAKLRLLTECHYTDGAVTYQWQVSNQFDGPWTDIAGATSNEYTPPLTTDKFKYYRLKVMSTTCAAIAYTNVATIRSNKTCAVRIIEPFNSTFCSSRPPAFIWIEFQPEACNSGADYKQEWEYRETFGSTTWNSTSVTANAINAILFFKAADRSLTFRLKVTSLLCGTVTYSNEVIIRKMECQLPPTAGKISISPNPTAAGRTVSVKTNFDGFSKIDLRTVEGARIKVTVVSSSKGIITLKLPDNIASGTYLLTINNQNGQWTEKIILNN